MNTIKTPKEIQRLNYNDIAFFYNASIYDAKWKIAPFIFNSPNILEINLSKSGAPKITIKETVEKNKLDTKIKSCSALDGLNLIDYTIETYNKGIPADRLLKYADSSSFAKALKFTGAHSILNDILNREQLKKVQKSWLVKSIYSNNTFIDFQVENDWAADFVNSRAQRFSKFIKS